MTEPRRWLDERHTSGDLRRVLESAGAPPPLPTELNARFSEYAAGLAAQGVLAKVGGVSLWHKLFLTGGGSSKALVVLSLLGGLGVGAYALSPTVVPPSPSSSSRSVLPAVNAARARTTPPSLPAPTSSSAEALRDAAPSVRASAGRTSPVLTPSAARELEPTKAPVAASSGTSGIADEAKLLETARSFLDDSPALALDLTEQHRRLHPVGQLSAERELVAIEALLRLGRRAEAERRAAPRLAQAPDSLYARRLRQLLSPTPAASSNSNNH